MLLLVLLAAWCVLPFPLAVAVGRSFRARAPIQGESLDELQRARVLLAVPRPRAPLNAQ